MREGKLTSYMTHITAGTLVPSSVNGDIAIQWEWLKFNPSQNQNLVTDYDKTLHNLLRPLGEHVNPKFVPIGCKRTSAQIREI